MAIKELALITEKNNRKKKKEKEQVQLKAPTKQKTVQKPKTTTVKSNSKGKTYINKETISKKPTIQKPTVQKTTQKPVVTNKERLSSKDTFAGVKSNVKPVKSTKKWDKVSTGVYDIYESGGKYYYDNGREEKEIDKKFVENALKNNRKGVIGHYDKKGKFTEVDENGRRLTPKVIRKEKRENLSKQLNAMKNDIKSGNMNMSTAITDVANIADAATDFGPGKVYKNALKTGINAFDRVWTGSTKALEGVMDTANDLTTEITSRQNYLVNRAFGMSKKEAKKKMKEEQKANAEWVKRDLVKDFKDKTGYTKLQPQLEEGSLVTEKNLAGRILEGAGGMLPALAVGQAANLGLAAKSTEGLTGLAKAGTVLGNLGRGFANQAGANTILASTSYGSGIEEAYRNGATGKQARLYGLGNAVTELATEWLTGGIPGTKSEGVLDDIVESLIDKKTAKISNRYVSNVINAVVKSQAKGMGEGLEEAIAEIINPHLKNLTYSNGEKVNLEQVKDSALVGYAVGMFLNSPETIQEVKKGINDAKISPEKKAELKAELDALVEQSKQRNAINGVDVNEAVSNMQNQLRQSQMQQIDQMKKSGQIDAAQANQMIEQVNNDSYQQNRDLEQIAAQRRDYIENALKTGQISQLDAIAEIQALNNTLLSERERINGGQEQVKPQQTEQNVPQDNVENMLSNQIDNMETEVNRQEELNNKIAEQDIEDAILTEMDYMDNNNQQQVENRINEGEKTSGTFSTVAPYYSQQVNDSNYNDVRSNVEMEFTNKALNIASNLGIGVENIQNNVGGYSFDDGNGRVDELSYTYKLKDGTSNEDAKMFGCLLGDLGHETQESVVVGNYTNSNNENANLEYTLKLKDGSGIIKALKEAGITDYTFNKQTNELQLLLFKDNNGNFNEQEILDQFQKLNQVLGGKISEPTKNYVESELIESKDRQDIYGQWLESNRGTENRELYNQVEEAYNKVKEFNDKKPKEEQSSFSNENEENVITIKNDNLKDIPKDQIKGEDTGVSIGGKQVQMEIPIDSKPNKLGQYVPKDGFTQKELKSGKLGDSQFYKNATERANFIIDEVRQKIKDDNYMQHYRKVTNEESMQEAFDDLNTRGTEAIADFFNNDKELTSKDTAMGYLLIEQSQANGDYDFSTQVLRKMRSSATNAAQTLQMYNYYARLTPEGMYRWCGDQLLRAEEIFEKNKTKKWIEANKDRWQLTKEETDFIKTQMERVQELNKMNDDDITTVDIKGKPKEVTVDRAKQVEIAKIQAMIENKIPPEKGKSINAWMRISMLGNLKTIGTRNPMGNIALRPINDIGDAFASIVDYAISKKTGYRTKGILNPKAQVKGFKKGGSETVQDFRLGINTRNSKGNRFEIGEGKSFNDRHSTKSEVLNKGLNTLAKAGNISDRGVSFLLDLGDRPFYEASYAQSLENQMKLNGIEKLEDVPDWMKKIAETEGLERTYQDDNKYTQSVIAIRRAMNNVNIKGYGLGDVIIPFAKTPANLTKAIVDYSPAGFVNAITKGKELRTAINNGQFTPEMQHRFVNQLGKATAGTMLYAIGAALAKSGLITGAPDEDKDLADFMKNTLGIQPYSIKIGNKSYTYDWAQPVASGLAIPADISKTLKDAKKGEVDLEYIIHTAFSSGGKVLLEQSFLQGIQEVLGGYGDPIDNLLSEIEGLPARAIPTLMQQIVTYLDGTKRMSYGNKGTQNAIAQAQAKTPWAKDLPVYRNSLGKEVKMYGGKNNLFNVFINPANYSEGNVTKSAKEIYKVYQATNDKEILPRLVNNNLKNEDGSKLTNKQKSDFLKISGGIIDKNVKELTKDKDYQKMSDKKKAETIKGIVEYAYNKARKEITGHELSGANKKAENAQESGYAIADYFISNKMNKQEKKKSTQERNRYMEVKKKGIDGKTFDKFRAFVASDKARGESRTGGKTKRQKVIDYIQTLGNLTAKEKQALYEDWNNNQGFFTYYK